jgi:hypothetical protein
MENNLIPRLGTFFILIGLGLLILFVGSAVSRDVHYSYFFLALGTLALGSLFRSKAPRKESSRFASVRKAQERTRQRREEKIKSKAQKQ